ncbi:MAG: hypothetical protein E6040_09520 [Lachnospiraceae bacterium]|nr:hypothetical protein [Lachnospiraceae bacterium]
MEFISHRVNTVNDLKNTPIEFGVELDLRDNIDGSIYINHDPFVLGENFEDYLSNYHHGTMILNIKSERIEYKVLDLLKKYKIEKYFFLDSSFPMIKALTDQGELNIALRYSEFEGIDTIRLMSGRAKWVWVDCFNSFPLEEDIYLKLKNMGYKLCFVSPELQGQPEKIEEYAGNIKKRNINFDAICTKIYNIDGWKKQLNIS